MFHRRDFLAGLFMSIATHGICGSAARAQWPTGQPQPGGASSHDPFGQESGGEWPEAPSQAVRFSGCTFSGTAADLQAMGKIARYSGYPALDRFIAAEPPVLTSAFRIQPGFMFFNDAGSPNAMATPENVGNFGTIDGTVLFGRSLLTSEMQSHPAWGWSVIGIMAHEWAHIFQFSQHMNAPIPRMELQADFLAGWYLAGKALGAGYQFTEAMALSLFNKGDYDFNNPNHHGTPHQRVQAMFAGYTLMMQRGVTDIDQAFEVGASVVGL